MSGERKGREGKAVEERGKRDARREEKTMYEKGEIREGKKSTNKGGKEERVNVASIRRGKKMEKKRKRGK